MAGFLESDLQDSAAAAQEVLRAVDDVESGRAPSWERAGNAHTLSLSPAGAAVRDEMAEDAKPARLSLPELRRIVGEWAAFLEDRRT